MLLDIFLEFVLDVIELHRNIEFIINDSKYNKEVLEHFINKLNELNDSIKAKVDD